VRPAALEHQLERLLRRGYRPCTLSEALEKPRRRTLVVTFDDAFRSVEARALPLLSRLGVPGTVFVPTDFATGQEPMTWSALSRWVGTRHQRELESMSWDELRRLSDAGWEIGSHTCSHPVLTELGDAEAADELRRSRRVCEVEIGKACTALAYPFGIFDGRVARLAEAAGYEAAAGLNRHVLEPTAGRGRFELPRDGVYRGNGRLDFDAKTSSLIRRARRSRLISLIPAGR